MSVLIEGMQMPETEYIDVRIFRDGTATLATGTKPYYRELKAEPVRHGKWVEHVDDRWGASHYFCSECGEKPLKEERTNRRCLSNFCPNCGARMEEPQESEVQYEDND